MKCYLHNQAEAVGTCTRCGKAICSDCTLSVDNKMVCKECTTALAEQAAYCRPRKDPFVAVILAIGGGLLTGSLLFSLGQLYNGQIKKFIALTLVNLFMGGIVAALYLGGSVVSLGIGFLCCLPVFLLPVLVYVYEIYDAYVTAARISRGELAYDWF